MWRGRGIPPVRRSAARGPGTPGPGTIWVHAVSVGEIAAAQRLLGALLDEYHPGHDLLLTTVTKGGRQYAQSRLDPRIRLAQLPHDTPGGARRFLEAADPALAIFIESEIWPNLFGQLSARNVPLLVLNGRISRRSARRFHRLGLLFRPAFAATGCVGAQTPTQRARFRFLGAPRVTVTGNLKFDNRPDPEDAERGRAFRQALLGNFPGHRILLCASTRPGEEDALLGHLAPDRLGKTVLVVVPRHTERAGAVAEALARRGFSPARKSDPQAAERARAIVGDTLGEMALYYAAADVAIVGGSFAPFGGQNPVEAMALGTPVVTGPHCENFAPFIRDARRAGIIHVAKDAGEAARVALGLAGDPGRAAEIGAKGAEYALSLGGATERSMRIVREHLPPPG